VAAQGVAHVRAGWCWGSPACGDHAPTDSAAVMPGTPSRRQLVRAWGRARETAPARGQSPGAHRRPV
jgi:hypothetical protein